MAIVRTTPRETGTTGSGPPVTKNAPQAPQRGGRNLPQRASRPGASKPINSGDFVRDVRTELGRVTWPTREEVRAGVIVTIGLLVFFAFYIFGLDYIAEQFIGSMVQAKP